MGLYECPDHMYCGNPGDYNISLEDDGIFGDPMIQNGVSDFINFGSAIFAVFQIITQDSWTVIMFNTMNGSQGWMAISYCIFLILFGSFFLLNLFLAIIYARFVNQSELEFEGEEDAEDDQQKDQMEKSSSSSIIEDVEGKQLEK